MGSSFGRGGATQPVQDLANADCIIIQGSNMAECHPVAFQWVIEAKLRGARVIHVDPRFSRTSALADKYISTRAGGDIVLLGALINHVLENNLFFEEYVKHYTNASTLISEDYQDPEDLDGFFSGFDPETGAYDPSSWQYEMDEEKNLPVRDETLQHPRTVFQILKRHFKRYTPEVVEKVCGVSQEDFAYIAESIVKNSGRDKTTAFCYAVGWTQHTGGAQFIRTASILQLLMGNVGRPGSGILALRGHANIQGATDIPALFHILPGYLPMPKAGVTDTWETYLDSVGTKKQKGFWAKSEEFTASLLKAWWGESATKENNFHFDYLPRLTGAHGTYQTLQLMLQDKVDGYFVLGQNPAVGSSNGRLHRKALSHLKWLVVRDFNMIETATFWKNGPEIETGELKTEDIDTEVFFMPAANHTEKAGSFTQTQRMVQWRHQAVTPPGDAESELQFFFDLGNRIREALKDSDDPRDRPVLDMTWDYPLDEHGEVDAEAVIREINGYYTEGENKGKPLAKFVDMKADGSTAGGCWIYAGVYADGINHAAVREPADGRPYTEREWGWVWPANRKILYNRASADPEGKPWSPEKAWIWWDEDQEKWVGHDVPDFPVGLNPKARPDATVGGPAALAGDDAFIMQPDGKGWLFAPKGMIDGPIPTHYEPVESKLPNIMYPQQNQPTRVVMPREENLTAPGYGEPLQEVYPYVFTTYRLTEHHTAGGMSRWLPYLAELQPEMFAEISPELAEEVGVKNGEWATLISPRAAIEARVLVTKRFKPLNVNGHTVHQIGLPYHWGVGEDAIITGDGANDLLGITMDPNTGIQDSKYSSVAMIPGRRPRGPELVDLVEKYQREAGITLETGMQRVTVPANDTGKAETSTEQDAKVAEETTRGSNTAGFTGIAASKPGSKEAKRRADKADVNMASGNDGPDGETGRTSMVNDNSQASHDENGGV